jgi:hypothetical protein
VIDGRFETGRYVPGEDAPAVAASLTSLVGGLLSAGGVIQPVLSIVGQIVSLGGAVGDLAGRMTADGRSENPIGLVPRLLRAAAEERPTVCLIEQADEAEEGWWGDVVSALAQEVSGELPLLLVLSVDECDRERLVT